MYVRLVALSLSAPPTGSQAAAKASPSPSPSLVPVTHPIAILSPTRTFALTSLFRRTWSRAPNIQFGFTRRFSFWFSYARSNPIGPSGTPDPSRPSPSPSAPSESDSGSAEVDWKAVLSIVCSKHFSEA
jgi:hypothetical protein